MKRRYIFSAAAILITAVFVMMGCGSSSNIGNDSNSSDNNSSIIGSIIGDSNDNDNVPKLGKIRAEDTLDVKFALIGDLHFVSDFKMDWFYNCWGFIDERGNELRSVSNHVNKMCQNFDYGPKCTGIINLGDLLRVPKGSGHWDDSVATYRHFYEYDHPKGRGDGCGVCKYSLYPAGDAQTKYPVFVGLGNHDDPTEFDDDTVQKYVRDRMARSYALFQTPTGVEISNYYYGEGGDLYAWEWGNVHFIWLGPWAFYGGYNDSNRNKVDGGKIKWLREHLKAIGKDKAIVLLQHFGWDNLSLGEPDSNGKALWWSTANIRILGDVICDRNDAGEDCSDPYNVIGIFTAHLHDWDYEQNICINGNYNIADHANDRHWNECFERLDFDNYVVDDGGHDSKGGFYLVRLQINNTKADSKNIAEGTMTINKVIMEFKDSHTKHDDCFDWEDYTPSVNDHGWPKVVNFTTEHRFFEQGEPNNAGGIEHCARIKASGRFNDVKCDNEYRVLCKNSGVWGITETWDYKWREGFEACRSMGVNWHYSIPETVKDQKAIMVLLDEKKSEGAWINYTEKQLAGKWIEAPWFFEFFSDNEPSNGSGRFEKGWGENCAVITSNNQLINDQECENKYTNFLCKSSTTGWYIKNTEAKAWQDGFSVCPSEFVFPVGRDDFLKLQKVVKDSGISENIWLGSSDLDEEGTWVDNVPWIAETAGWKSGEPNNAGGDEDCALMLSNGDWNDVPCGNYHENGFACRNYESGAWKKSASKSTNWIDGFQACRDLGLRYYFAAPIREEDNDKLHTLTENDEIWLNYTDAHEEGKWQHGYWENWASGQPDNTHGHEDCVSTGVATREWNDANCIDELPVLCRYDGILSYGIGEWEINLAKFVTWRQATDQCSNNSGGWKFTYPTCPSEQEELNALPGSGHPFWIQYNDIDAEGSFSPWY